MAEPVTEGTVHRKCFMNALDNFILETFKDVSGNKIKDIFNQCSSSNAVLEDKVVQKMQSAIGSYVQKGVNAEVTEALEENSCDQKFDELLSLKVKYKGGPNAWRPPYDAKDHMKAARIVAKKERLKKLDVLLSMKKLSVDRIKEDLNVKMNNFNFDADKIDNAARESKNLLTRCKQVSTEIAEANVVLAKALSKPIVEM